MESRTDDLLSLACNAIQSQERMVNALKLTKRNNETLCSLHGTHVSLDKVIDQSLNSLENTRAIKSQLEGSTVWWTDYTFDESTLLKLKQLVLMHIPGSFDVNTKQEFGRLIEKCFEGKCKSIIFASLMSCPWYRATQDERGQQAKHNVIVVVFVSHDQEYFCPVDLHKKEQNSVIDLGWLYAVEATHFAQYLSKGKTRFVESLFAPDCAVLLNSEHWNYLQECVDYNILLGQRGFIEECRGQAVGALGKKSKSGHFKLRDTATLYDCCGSIRLLQYASQSLENKPLDLVSSDVACDPLAERVLEKITKLFKEDRSVTKVEVFDLILQWKKNIDDKLARFTFQRPEILAEQIGRWLKFVRIGRETIPPRFVADADKGNLRVLMEKIGGTVSKMQPEQILMIAQAGSFLYNLSTPESDVDFVVIYAAEPMTVYSSTKRLNECMESRGPDKLFEYGAYEARLFCEMVWKGSVVILELLFADNLEYTSESWKRLVERRQEFVSETAIRQYLGLIRNNMVMIENKKHLNAPRGKKLFYQIFHKLYSLEYMLNGQAPPVRCTDEERDFIMKIRRGPLEGDISREILYDIVNKRLNKLRNDLASRKRRLPENINPDILTSWIMGVRQWPGESLELNSER